jgi:osmoprotectant transport system ATP-binding protein
MIALEEVSKQYSHGAYAVDHLSLDIGDGELCVLVGPSGCGKTTTLRMVNRLVEPTSGRILFDGNDTAKTDPVALRRRMGYVIQSAGLFPHLRVADNVAVAPQLLGWDKARTKTRVNELLDLVGLDPGRFARRFPHELSGGQQQRVGVARALGGDPEALLMDEPFGAVDPIARERLQGEFLRLQAQLRKTVIFVTHDIEEAVTMGDRIAVLRQGGILEQYDTPAEVLGRPATPFVADFVGADRGLRRLAVTPIEITDLQTPPVLAPEATMDEARAAVAASDGRWAVVVDAAGRLTGWVEPDAPGAVSAAGADRVADHTRPLEAQVTLDESLKAAFSEMLQYDAGWVAVLEGRRYLGVLTPDALHAALRRSVGGQPVEV